jgi:hypothetical protein
MPTKVRDFLDFDFIGARLVYEHYEGTREFKWIRFYSTNSKSKEQQAAEALEDEIVEHVRMYPGIGHQKLASLVGDALAAKGKGKGINVIRGAITTLATTGKLRRAGDLSGYEYFIP